MIDADDLHLEGGLRSLLLRAEVQPKADMVVGAFRRRTDGEDRHIKLPSGYTATSIANASAYLEGQHPVDRRRQRAGVPARGRRHEVSDRARL